MDGYRVYVPDNIQPSAEEMKILVQSADGDPIKTKPNIYRDDTIILANEDDQKAIEHFSDIGYNVYSGELIFSGCLVQKFNFKQNILAKGK